MRLSTTHLNMTNARCHFWHRRDAREACNKVIAKQSLNRRSTKMECTLFDKHSKQKAHHGSCINFPYKLGELMKHYWNNRIRNHHKVKCQKNRIEAQPPTHFRLPYGYKGCQSMFQLQSQENRIYRKGYKMTTIKTQGMVLVH